MEYGGRSLGMAENAGRCFLFREVGAWKDLAR
jgi:hypothetical protein